MERARIGCIMGTPGFGLSITGVGDGHRPPERVEQAGLLHH